MNDEIDEYENLLPDLVREILQTTNRSVEVSIPCMVTKVISRTKVNVKPLIKVVAQDGTSLDRAEIEGLPVFTAGAGDKFISFPVAVGSIGWLDACDRDISLFLQSYDNTEPPTSRMHSFSDARFVPDIMTNITIAEEDATAIVIQNRDGTVKITLDDEEIRIKNDDVSLVVSGTSVTGVASGGFDLNGFTIASNGAAQSPVSITAPSAVIDGKELAGHTHAGSATAPDGPVSSTGANE